MIDNRLMFIELFLLIFITSMDLKCLQKRLYESNKEYDSSNQLSPSFTLDYSKRLHLTPLPQNRIGEGRRCSEKP